MRSFSRNWIKNPRTKGKRAQLVSPFKLGDRLSMPHELKTLTIEVVELRTSRECGLADIIFPDELAGKRISFGFDEVSHV